MANVLLLLLRLKESGKRRRSICLIQSPIVAAQRKITFDDMLCRYRDEYSVNKKAYRAEIIRMNKILSLEKDFLCRKEIYGYLDKTAEYRKRAAPP